MSQLMSFTSSEIINQTVQCPTHIYLYPTKRKGHLAAVILCFNKMGHTLCTTVQCTLGNTKYHAKYMKGFEALPKEENHLIIKQMVG